MSSRFIRLGALLLALSTLAACGSTINRPTQVAVGGAGKGNTLTTGPDGSATTDDTTAEGGATASGGTTGATTRGATGGTATTVAAAKGPVKTGPVEIGFMVSTSSNAAAFGGDLTEKVDQHDIYNALVRLQNKAGGLSGRTIKPIFQTTDSGSNNTEADLAAACSNFVEDNKVEAVVGRIQDIADSYESCLSKRQIPHIVANPEGKDSVFMAKYPYLFNIMALTLEQRTRLKVDYAVATKTFVPADKIGVLYAGCPASQRSWENDAAPYFKSKGLNVASVFATGCPAGASEAYVEVGKIGNAILQFRSAGVNKMYFHADELAALFILANAAEAQGWRPSYFVSSLANTAVSGTQIPKPQAANVTGVGWSPMSDVLQENWPDLNPAAKKCLADLKSEGVVPVSPLDKINASIMCDSFSLFVEAVALAGGRVDGPSVAAAVKAIGNKHQSAYTYDGTSLYGQGRPNGVSGAYPFKWFTSCECFRYSGGSRIAIP